MQNWTIPQDFKTWQGAIEKRLKTQERRPQIRTASDLMGPALGPYAVEVVDWNSDEAAFNAMIYSEPGAANTPGDGWFIGWSTGNKGGDGLQWACTFMVNSNWKPTLWVRQFTDPTDSGMRIYTAWFPLGGEDEDSIWDPVLPAGVTVEPWPGGIRVTWDGTIDGGGSIPLPGFRNLEITVE